MSAGMTRETATSKVARRLFGFSPSDTAHQPGNLSDAIVDQAAIRVHINEPETCKYHHGEIALVHKDQCRLG